jgi:hypothetical protein
MTDLPNDVWILIVYRYIQRVEHFEQVLNLRCVSRRLGWMVEYYLHLIQADPIGWTIQHQCKGILKRWFQELPRILSSQKHHLTPRFVYLYSAKFPFDSKQPQSWITSLLVYVQEHSESWSFFLWVWNQLYHHTKGYLSLDTNAALFSSTKTLPTSFLFHHNTAAYISLYIEHLRCCG